VKHAKHTERPQASRRALWLLLALALALRAGLTVCTAGYKYDVNCFFAWALRMAETGPRGFYAADYFCDYPPAYLYALWLVGKGMKLLGLNYLQKGAALLLTLLPALADCALAALLYGIALPRHGARVALWMAGAAAFCPVLLYDTAVWKQIDGFFALWLVLCFALLEAGEGMPTRRRCCAAALCYGVALAVKPQALLAGPVLALGFLRPIFGGKNGRGRLAACGTAALGVVCALAPVLLCALPFYGISNLATGLAERYFATTQSYPYASIDAFNLMAFLGGNWAAQTDRVGALPFTWQQLGMAALVLLTIYTVWLAVRAARRGKFSALLLAAFYMIGVFTVSHRMHERYLIPGILLLLAAAALAGSRRLLVLAQGFGLTALLDLAAVYTNVDGDDQFLTGAVSTQLMRAAGLAETVLFVLLAVAVWQACSGKALAPLAVKPRPEFIAAPAPQPRWTRAEAAGLAVLTLAVAAGSFYGLGDTTAPQTCVDANGTTYIAQLDVEGEAAELWVYPGISSYNKGYLTVTDAAGEIVLEKELNYTSPFTWASTQLGTSSPYYTVTVEDGQIFELAFRDASGALLAVREQVLDAGEAQGAGSLCDEAALVPDTISYKNSFYFDEIYHARTGYELLHGMHIYETTHPPLGKDFIALGIALFGMTAFGWRFFGTLFGVLLVPLVYLLVRRLLRKPWLAGVAAGLMALDFMRFTQSRLATIDTCATFFILLGALCMLWYAQRALTHGVGGALLPMALGGVAFGLGCAAKWTGVYAGAGLAVLYFGVLARRYAQLHAALGADGRELTHAQRGAKHRLWLRELLLALGGGVLFYVLVPLGIYLAAYLPYRAGDASFGLADWWACQLSMFRYHSTLEATHPFSSSWYAWLGDLRPVWYYQGSGLAAGQYSSIAGFVSPVLAWCGLAALVWLLARQAGARGTAAGGFVLVCYGSNLLPWLLVTRCTFLYHYFPCLPFLAAAIALALNALAHKNERRARAAAVVLLGAAAVLFVWFYPVLAGVPVSGAWAASLKWLPSWGFYIL
jgi:predicted membrane-bound dolichyl-phosphate-mannose-protein mannosyltransferase/Gpi18-like mannosyltransferase